MRQYAFVWGSPNSRTAEDELACIMRTKRLLMKIIDKGGVTVVMVENKLVTTYSYGSKR